MTKWLLIFSLFGVCGGIAWFLVPLFEVNYNIALIMAMILAYVALSAYLELFRYRLRKRVKEMTAEERAILAQDNPELLLSIAASSSMTSRVTVFAGTIAVNLPIIPLIVGPLALLKYVFNIYDPLYSALSLVLGFILAWSWWSISITVWRWWANKHRGMPLEEVQWRGEEASLVWPKGHLLEKTELGKILSRWKKS